MLDAAKKALHFAEGRNRDDLEDEDDLLLHALVRLITVIGEAANRVGPETRSELDLPWPEVVGMRNRLTHAYFDINRDILWATVQKDLPVLIRTLETALAEPEDEGSVHQDHADEASHDG